MIEIISTAENRQLENGDWKEAIYYSDDSHDAWRAMKKRAKLTGAKIGLMLIENRAEVQPVADVFLSEVETKLQDIITGIETYKSSKTMGEEQHAESVEQV